MRPLELVRPFLAVLPDIEPPQRRVPFREKVLYTGVCLFVFLVASQLPLYGIKSNAGADPFYWARVIMASNRCVVGFGGVFSFLLFASRDRGISVPRPWRGEESEASGRRGRKEASAEGRSLKRKRDESAISTPSNEQKKHRLSRVAFSLSVTSSLPPPILVDGFGCVLGVRSVCSG